MAQNLDIGSGGYCKPGFEGVDAVPGPAVKHVMDVTKEFPFTDVDEIYCNSFLEHLTQKQAIDLIQKFKDALRPGGKLEIIVPDLEYVCKQYLKADPMFRVNYLHHIYGQQNNEFEIHKTGFDAWYLEGLLKQHFRFKNVMVTKIFSHSIQMLKAEAWKNV